jgi:hypothetical protein
VKVAVLSSTGEGVRLLRGEGGRLLVAGIVPVT